ncbi:hypothetical protein [Pseudoalteromonas sp.]|uniref:hypothetical protein n=1 Tax=Pseudoalteromonas sp. TaxID=53249 RepID=UPI00272D8F0C|nr:hypothetical protein [Pseudoalteromonas sp.]
MNQELLERAKQNLEGKGFSAKIENNTLYLVVDENMFELAEYEIEYQAGEEANHASINSDEELSSLASEFDGEVELSNPTDRASLKAINSARRLVQRSTDQFSIVIPDNVYSLWSGEGCGEWLPAMVYIPNKEIR